MRVVLRRLAVVGSIFAVLIQPGALAAQSQKDLTAPPASEWRTSGGSLSNQRHSTLDQINTGNVKDLKGKWVTHLGSGLGSKYSFEASPVVQDGVMYLASGNDDVFALDARTGAEKWEHLSGIDQNINSVCCGWDNRGVALGENRVFVGQLDGTIVALDQNSGDLLWKTQIARWQDGYTITAAPRYFDGLLFTGISGADRGIRGKLTALDAKTGQEVWHFYTVPAPGDVGGDSWPDDGYSYLHGGASVWNTPSIDPDLGMLYFSTGNAYPGSLGSYRPGDNLFASSIVALDYRTGQYKWHFQEVHHDLWDYDAPNPTVLFDQSYNGQTRKAIAEAGKTGWIYLLDRTNGQPLLGVEEKPVPQEPRNATAQTQPFPVGDPLVPQCADALPGWPLVGCVFSGFYDQPVLAKPAVGGGVNWAPMAFSPQTGYLYATAMDYNWAFVRPPDSEVTRDDTGYTGARATSPLVGSTYSGTYTAIDSRTNKIAWQKTMPYRIGQGSGTLSTAGGLLFHGEPDGNVLALNAQTGDELWRWQAGYGADAPAVTYELDGQQYVAIAAGGVTLAVGSQNGDAVWAFALDGKLAPFSAPKTPPTGVAFTQAIVSTRAVKVMEFTYDVARATIPVGSVMNWANTGSQAHTATASDNSWDTGPIAPGQSATVEFDTPGTYTYICTPHPWMTAQVIVSAPGP
jgi:quinohemoprotein ethanol dehydrogenase